MKYTFYTNSVDAFDGMESAIRAAEVSIYWESYIFVDDLRTHHFLDLLKEKADAGIKIKIVLDSIGSFQFFNDIQHDLATHGVELLFFNRLLPWYNPRRLRRWWFLRTHRKLLIIDGRIGFIGGVNVGHHYRRWHDLHLRLEGAIVRHFTKSFAYSYRISGGKDRLEAPTQKDIGEISPTKILFLEHYPFWGRSYLRSTYKTMCAAATRRIVIVTPYFVPHRWLMRALQLAISRGVVVEVVVPRTTDNRLLNAANRVFIELGAKNGIVFFLFPEMIHAKALLVDDQKGIMGSNNIDALSFDYNLEASVAFSDEHMVGDLRSIIERWKSMSTVYSPNARKKSWYSRVVVALVRLLQPFL